MTQEALKLALDLATMHHTDDGYAALREKVRSAIKEALAQPEQIQPSAYSNTHQPERTWVGLTDEEIKALASWWPSYDQIPALMVLAKDIQNSLKEKNT